MIELPPLNITLVAVHKELAIVRSGAMDIVLKNKTMKKAKKYAKHQLEEAQKTITELEHHLQKATASCTPKQQNLHDEVEA